MPLDKAKVGRVPRRRRRTVRIVQPRSTSRTATVSFLVTAAAALLLLAIWKFLRADEPLLPVQRPPSEVIWNWKCDQGHSFRAPGQGEPRACPRCSLPSYPVETWECKEHGDVEVAVRFRVDAEGVLDRLQHRVERGEWTPAEEPVLCSRCGRRLRHKPDDPFEGMPRRKKTRRGGTTRGG